VKIQPQWVVTPGKQTNIRREDNYEWFRERI
jgi:hypothetical protein